jgi:very-short-patch-repair endonuclease
MKPKKLTEAQLVLETHMKELGLTNVEVEFKFYAPMRRWACDYYIPREGIQPSRGWIIEIEGSVYAQGRHTRGKGYEEDCVKYSTASALGYRVYRFSTGQVLDGSAKEFLKKWL